MTDTMFRLPLDDEPPALAPAPGRPGRGYGLVQVLAHRSVLAHIRSAKQRRGHGRVRGNGRSQGAKPWARPWLQQRRNSGTLAGARPGAAHSTRDLGNVLGVVPSSRRPGTESRHGKVFQHGCR